MLRPREQVATKGKTHHAGLDEQRRHCAATPDADEFFRDHSKIRVLNFDIEGQDFALSSGQFLSIETFAVPVIMAATFFLKVRNRRMGAANSNAY